MTDEKKKVEPEQPTEEVTPPVENQAPPMYTLEQTQKMMEQVKADARKAAIEEFKKQQEAEQKAAAEKAKLDKRNSLIEQIDSDEASKKWFSEIDPEYNSKSLDWLEGVQKARSIQKQEFESKNTAKPEGTGTVAPVASIDSFFAKKQKEIMERKGVKKW
jgi:hypothetical protein